jgi:transmembrane sensor
MNQLELQRLLEKFASGSYTNAEYQTFISWKENCSAAEYEQMLVSWEAIIENNTHFEPFDKSLFEKIELGLDQIDGKKIKPHQQLHVNADRKISLWPSIVAAASILLFVAVGLHFIFQKKQPAKQIAHNLTHDIGPGGNKAMLTLANGQKIILDDAKNGLVANQGNAVVNKNQGGGLVYTAQTSTESHLNDGSYDTLTTPRAGIYHITLADGSKIWLNAATSIRYPAAFTGKYRTVELLYGEAYYEVNHNSNMPFRVIVGSQITEDIGTSFNINAYRDEPVIKTTLLEGSVRVAEGNTAEILKPEQQSQINVDGENRKIKVVNGADIDEIIAWKNGFFQFTNADLQTVMRQLARWYDMDVVYNGPISKSLFTGDIHRNINASEAMQILAFLNIDYKITGKKITITSNKTNN